MNLSEGPVDLKSYFKFKSDNNNNNNNNNSNTNAQPKTLKKEKEEEGGRFYSVEYVNASTTPLFSFHKDLVILPTCCERTFYFKMQINLEEGRSIVLFFNERITVKEGLALIKEVIYPHSKDEFHLEVNGIQLALSQPICIYLNSSNIHRSSSSSSSPSLYPSPVRSLFITFSTLIIIYKNDFIIIIKY